MKLKDKIIEWLKKQVKTSGKKGIVLGLSGGIDSAVVAVLSKIALGDNVLGLILPCGSNPEDSDYAKKLSKKFGIKTKKIPLNGVFDELIKTNKDASEIAKANLKPRLRMTVLYYFANSLDYLVAGTGNKSELAVGYFTKYGDGGVDLLPLGDIVKSEIRKLAEDLDIPREIIERAPSAGLWEGQTDEKEMGITYKDLDKVIEAIDKNDVQNIDSVLLEKVRKMMRSSEHKRCNVPVFKKEGAL